MYAHIYIMHTASSTVLTCSPNSVMMLAPTFPALTGFGPLLPGSGGISRESSGWSCDSEEEEGGCGLDLRIKAEQHLKHFPCNHNV